MVQKLVGERAAALLAKLSGRQKEAKKFLPLRTGKRRAKIARYYDIIRPKRKLRHLLNRNGVDAARAWAEKNDAVSVFKKLLG
jgi:hypothetical protein